MMRRPHPATVLALLALAVALSPHAVAASKKLIGSKQLANNAVTTKKIKNSAVTAAKLSNNAVTTKKLRKGAVTADKLAAGVIPAIPAIPAFPSLSEFVLKSESYTKSDVDGKLAAAAAVLPSRTFFVRADGTAQQNGDRLRSTIAGLSASGSGNGVLINVDAGNFELGSSTITLRGGTQLRGAGVSATVITASNTAFRIDGGSHGVTLSDLYLIVRGGPAAVVTDANTRFERIGVSGGLESGTMRAIDARNGNVEASDCVISAGGTVATAVESNNPTIRDCTLFAGGTSSSYGVRIVSSAGAGPQLVNSRVNTSNAGTAYGIYMEPSTSVAVRNSIAEGGNGGSGAALYLAGSTVGHGVEVIGGELDGNPAISHVGGTVYVAHAEVAGAIVGNALNRFCVGTYNNGYGALNTDCE